jgi:phospholipid/cholesterol/gamma-HCH transport system substrate-binding protein
MENQSHALVAGLFVVLLALAAIGGALWLGPSKGPKLVPVDLLTRYSIVGLKADAPVRFRGVDIGHVESIAFDPHQLGRIRVRVGVDPAAPLTRSTFAKVSYQGITGVAFIQLDDALGTKSAPLLVSGASVPEIDLQASFLDRAEADAHELVMKADRVASRLDELLSEPNQKRIFAVVDSLQRTVEGYGTLSRELQPTAKALPALLQKAQGTVDRVGSLADDVDQRLTVLDALTSTAKELDDTTQDLHQNTLPRVNALLDEASVDARELKRALREVDTRPQSFIFGLQPPPPGPGEPGFVDARSTVR